MEKNFNIVVIGGGHAGLEAVCIAKELGIKVALITMPNVGIASAPCNPSIGGVGKGQVVREIDALGGVMGFLADRAGIQFRTLNDSKGFAVQSTRVQIDKIRYSEYAEVLVKEKNIPVFRNKVLSIKKDNNGVFVIETTSGSIGADKIIVTVGTFLNGKLHFGLENKTGGRVDCDSSSSDLVDIFASIKKSKKRFKTGTPSRLHKDSIDYSKLKEQESDPNTRNFHLLNTFSQREQKQVSCYLTYTNSETMSIIRSNKERSPMFNGQIKGVGARYCPSIEDKAFRYPDKDIHHVFIEPEGLELESMYPSGISSSLPVDVQESFIKSISGLENSKIIQPGYAVEYDVVDTTELTYGLEHKEISGLYFAGQVNGTSGYEEAAGQGLVAGINAAFSVIGKEQFILSRNDSYIGVMIEDLITNFRDEPYRLFTARSENRLYIREDNVVQRMWSYRTKLGLKNKTDEYQTKFVAQFNYIQDLMTNFYVDQDHELLKSMNVEVKRQRISLSDAIRQAHLSPIDVLNNILKYFSINLNQDLINTLAISIYYEGYINKAKLEYEKLNKLDGMKIKWEELANSNNISFECKQRIEKIKPLTFGQLKLIDGIRPATLAVVAGQNY
jgi:tRNA uridine 5-carboxymethylaminomethyl modification enzyme